MAKTAKEKTAAKEKKAVKKADQAEKKETDMATFKTAESEAKLALQASKERGTKMDAEAKKAAEKSEKNAAKMAAMQVRFQMMAKQQKDAAASLALAMKAKSPQENNKKQMAL